MDWAAFNIAMYELFWISPQSISESDSDLALLADEFQRNLITFMMPRIIHREIDGSLLARPLHELRLEEQLKLRMELRVAEYFGP